MFEPEGFYYKVDFGEEHLVTSATVGTKWLKTYVKGEE